jgi:hypothetical protein
MVDYRHADKKCWLNTPGNQSQLQKVILVHENQNPAALRES